MAMVLAVCGTGTSHLPVDLTAWRTEAKNIARANRTQNVEKTGLNMRDPG